jgi:hypothetical protein
MTRLKLRTARRAALGASALWMALAGTAVAETAEEAVAYVFMGLADGASFKRATTTLNWTEASPSPAVFDGDMTIGERAAKVRFTVTALDPCHYEVSLEGPMVLAGGKALYARIDLTGVSGVTPAADAISVEIEGDGFCETGQKNPACMKMNESDLFGYIDAKRHADAVAFIRSSVCPATVE